MFLFHFPSARDDSPLEIFKVSGNLTLVLEGRRIALARAKEESPNTKGRDAA